MRLVNLMLFIILITKSCTCTVKVDKFEDEELGLLSYYQHNKVDTIFFENDIDKDLDTIVFEGIDSMVNPINSFMSNPNRSISIQIFYLPFPNVHNFNPYNSLIPTNSSSMLSITRDNTRQSPTIYLLYRDFWGEIDDISKTIKDSLLSEFHINEYWLIEDRGDNSNKRGKAVEKVIWTQELGLTSYYLKNGAYYKLKL